MHSWCNTHYITFCVAWYVQIREVNRVSSLTLYDNFFAADKLCIPDNMDKSVLYSQLLQHWYNLLKLSNKNIITCNTTCVRIFRCSMLWERTEISVDSFHIQQMMKKDMALEVNFFKYNIYWKIFTGRGSDIKRNKLYSSLHCKKVPDGCDYSEKKV